MNQAVRITKEFSFEMAHALDFHNGLCKNIHGHSYILSVTLKGKPKTSDSPDKGMVLDFKLLKQIVKEHLVDKLDHALLLEKESPYAKSLQAVDHHKMILVDFQPTCENMIIYFANVLEQKLPEGTSIYKLKLQETATGYAEWYSKDNS